MALIFVFVPAAGYLKDGWQLFYSLCAGFVLFLAALVPMISAQQRGEILRFRWAIVFSLVGISWMAFEFGRVAGIMLTNGPKRVYFLRLQDKIELYANIILYTSGGVIYRTGDGVYFSPNDAVLFTRRTGMRRRM